MSAVLREKKDTAQPMMMMLLQPVTFGHLITLIALAAAGGNVVTSPTNDVLRVIPNVMCSAEGNVDTAWKLVQRGSCFVELRSWGGDDSQKVGYSLINDVVAANYTNSDNSLFRGFNTNQIRSQDCTAFDYRHFDTWAAGPASSAMVTYLRSLAYGTVVYGVTCDEPTSALYDDARAALLALGVNITALVYRGKLAFVAVIGRPESTASSVAGVGGGNLVMKAIVTKTIQDYAGYCYVELCSWGYDDPQHTGYARVNGEIAVDYTRFNGYVRGFNFNVLQTDDCATTDSRHFDTWELTQASTDMAQYLQALAIGTVLYGVTCDDATLALQPVARKALLAIGIDAPRLVFRGKLTFVAVIGDPQSTVFRISSNGSQNLIMDALVAKSSANLPVSIPTTSTTTATTTNAHWFPIAVTSLVVNAITIAVITLLTIYARKLFRRSQISHFRPRVPSPVQTVTVISSKPYQGLRRALASGNAAPNSVYDELPVGTLESLTPSPAYNIIKLTSVAEAEDPDYLQLQSDNYIR